MPTARTYRLNDGTFDNRGLSPRRIIIGSVVALVAMLLILPLVAATGGIGSILLAVPLVMFVLWFRKRSRTSLLERMPTTKIEELRGGYVEVAGHAMRADARELRDPIRDEPCVWFGVETLRQEKGSMPMWLPMKRAASSRLFKLRESTGPSCFVDPRGAQFALRAPIEVTVNDEVKHRIWRILEGDAITVVGRAEALGNGWCMRRSEDGKYLVTDEPASSGKALS